MERLGEARYLAPGMAGWEQVEAGSMVPAGSQITTGTGGRLIVHQAANQLSVGTGSRFILPGWEPGDSVRHTAGWLRYRIATAPAAAFGIETPFLDLVVDDAVLDVTVGETETEVAVVSGRVRVKTSDERRQIDLRAGYTGYASLQGDPLAIRRGPGQSLEAVPPVVMPALHPNRAGSAGIAPAAVDAGTAAIAAFAGRAPTPADPPVPAAQPPAAAALPAASAATPASVVPATAPAPRSLVVAPLAQGPLAQAPLAQGEARPATESAVAGPAPPASDSEPAEQIRRGFEGLTEGLLDGLQPALPLEDRR